MAAYGVASHGKKEQRKEMSLIALAHRGKAIRPDSGPTIAYGRIAGDHPR